MQLLPAQKQVPASSVVGGTQVFRSDPERGDFMMVVDSVERGTVSDGTPVFVWAGAVYRLVGAGTGPNAAFLGDITAIRAGRGVWKFPTELRVHVGALKEDADYEY